MNKIVFPTELPSTKEGISRVASKIIDQILEEGGDMLSIAVQLSSIELLVKALKENKELRSLIIEEVEKEGRSTTKNGVKIEIKETGVKYDYSNCNDLEFESLNSDSQKITEKLKKRQDFLKNLPENEEVYSSDGVLLHRPIRTSSTTPVVTIPTRIK